MKTKICKKCNVELSIENFEVTKVTSKGTEIYRTICKKCRNNSRKNYHKKYNSTRDPKSTIKGMSKEEYNRCYAKDKNMTQRIKLRLYNITEEDYNNLKIKCNNTCMICGKAEENINSELAIDHDHITRKVRGLLCRKCNSGLGFFKDSTENLEKAILYLKNFQN